MIEDFGKNNRRTKSYTQGVNLWTIHHLEPELYLLLQLKVMVAI